MDHNALKAYPGVVPSSDGLYLFRLAVSQDYNSEREIGLYPSQKGAMRCLSENFALPSVFVRLVSPYNGGNADTKTVTGFYGLHSSMLKDMALSGNLFEPEPLKISEEAVGQVRLIPTDGPLGVVGIRIESPTSVSIALFSSFNIENSGESESVSAVFDTAKTPHTVDALRQLFCKTEPPTQRLAHAYEW